MRVSPPHRRWACAPPQKKTAITCRKFCVWCIFLSQFCTLFCYLVTTARRWDMYVLSCIITFTMASCYTCYYHVTNTIIRALTINVDNDIFMTVYYCGALLHTAHHYIELDLWSHIWAKWTPARGDDCPQCPLWICHSGIHRQVQHLQCEIHTTSTHAVENKQAVLCATWLLSQINVFLWAESFHFGVNCEHSCVCSTKGHIQS